MSNAPDLFLGLVTHPTSAFNRDNRAGKLLDQLTEALTSHGLRVDSLISDRNDYSPEDFPVNRASLIEAAEAQSALERQWREYVNVRAGTKPAKNAQSFGLYLAMLGKRTAAALRGKGSSAARAYERLVNIDLSHLRILSEGIHSGAAGIVILEDDASISSQEQIQVFVQVINAALESNIDFVNLSESISASELGIEPILGRARTIHADQRSKIIELDTPLTNTVCANYYSSDFAKKFCEHIAPPNHVPVKPIDWRLNQVMLANPTTRTWWVQPGIFVQGSMHAEVNH